MKLYEVKKDVYINIEQIIEITRAKGGFIINFSDGSFLFLDEYEVKKLLSFIEKETKKTK
ncbi:MAG: hypothetical protein RMJ13_07980 [Elusimicrobiota bacterium]|nr:hypothetical protein [Elusimicrobiota bacterium]